MYFFWALTSLRLLASFGSIILFALLALIQPLFLFALLSDIGHFLLFGIILGLETFAFFTFLEVLFFLDMSRPLSSFPFIGLHELAGQAGG